MLFKFVGQYVTIEKIILDDDLRVVRPAIGKKKSRWFVRIDLWSVGYRFTRTRKEQR